MRKYEPLTRHLVGRNAPRIAMRFDEIERVLGFALPRSSRRYRACWSNNPRNSVMTKAWLAAGYKSREVEMENEQVIFVRLNLVEDNDRIPARHPIFGAMKGLSKIPPDLDLTEPADPDWGAGVHDRNDTDAGAKA